MEEQTAKFCTAFVGDNRAASGSIEEVALRVKEFLDESSDSIVIFDDETSQQIEVDFRGTLEDVRTRLVECQGLERQTPGGANQAIEHKGPGRPKLGVIPREVTLLPRHWEWLAAQPGGASVAIRKLVETARRTNSGKDRVRASQESTYKFISAMAGNRPGFEEATRALFKGDESRFNGLIDIWPPDIQAHARMLATGAFQGTEELVNG